MNHMQWTFPFVCDDFPLANSTTECVNLPEPEPFTGKVSLKIRAILMMSLLRYSGYALSP